MSKSRKGKKAEILRPCGKYVKLNWQKDVPRLFRVKKCMKKIRRSNSEASKTPFTSNTRNKCSPHLKVRLNFSNANKAASVRKRQKTALRQAYRKK